MPNAEWEKLKEALKKPPTPEARREAAEAFKKYAESKKGRTSKPTLVSLGFRKTYPSSIPLDKVADEIQKNPEFFKLMGRIVKVK